MKQMVKKERGGAESDPPHSVSFMSACACARVRAGNINDHLSALVRPEPTAIPSHPIPSNHVIAMSNAMPNKLMNATLSVPIYSVRHNFPSRHFPPHHLYPSSAVIHPILGDL